MVGRATLHLYHGIAVGMVGSAVAVMLLLAIDGLPPPLTLIALLVAMGLLWYFPHTLLHYLVGRAVGVRFKGYSLGPSSLTLLRAPLLPKLAKKIPTLILLVDHKASRATGLRLALMHSAGVLASMLLPLLAALYAWAKLEPPQLSFFPLLLAIANLAFTLYTSPKVGDLSRAIRAIRRTKA